MNQGTPTRDTRRDMPGQALLDTDTSPPRQSARLTMHVLQDGRIGRPSDDAHVKEALRTPPTTGLRLTFAYPLAGDYGRATIRPRREAHRNLSLQLAAFVSHCQWQNAARSCANDAHYAAMPVAFQWVHVSRCCLDTKSKSARGVGIY